ncbi:MAG: YigZ family protein [Lachnospiraceae bacterium]|nr:YigZ family protein [Lachnospiraceae bacterium]
MNTGAPDSYKIIADKCEGSFEEKKSRFLSQLLPVGSEEEAAAFFDGVRKKYYDARHHCTALILGPGQELKRSSDDGEPSGTAGKPMLEVLTGAGLTNVAAVVTRYFGGTLLGTGGLIRAYSSAVKDALSQAKILTVCACFDLSVKAAYPDVGPIQYYITQNGITLLDTEYLENVSFRLRVRTTEKDRVIKGLTELTNGKAVIRTEKEGYEAL